MIDEELAKMIESLLKLLEENNLELNENGELIDKNTKKLVMGKEYE